MCLIIIFLSELTFAFLDHSPNQQLCLGSTYFQDKNDNDFTGFYDWLRSDDEKILGVRYRPFEQIAKLLPTVSNLSYVFSDKSKLEVYFPIDGKIVEEQSHDEDFGNNRVFSTDTGIYAVSFNLSFLSNSEIQSIKSLNVKWVI